MTDEAVFARALRMFEVSPGVSTMQRSISILALAGVDERRIRNFCRSVSERYGVWDYVGPNFESNVMVPGMRIAAAAKFSAEAQG